MVGGVHYVVQDSAIVLSLADRQRVGECVTEGEQAEPGTDRSFLCGQRSTGAPGESVGETTRALTTEFEVGSSVPQLLPSPAIPIGHCGSFAHTSI